MNKYLISILLFEAIVWLRSGYGKISGGQFVGSLPVTLGKFVSNNPYNWYKDFIASAVLPNANLFAQLIMYGEIVIGVSLLVGGLGLFFKKNKGFVYLLIIGLLGGLILNVNFWLASGWTSPSSDGFNMLMTVIGVIGLVAAFKRLKSNV